MRGQQQVAKKKRTKAERSAAAKASWERRRKGLPPVTTQRGKKAKKRRTTINHAVPVVAPGQPLEAFSAEPGYETLNRELCEAFNQSAYGKGKARHANGRPFDRQPILELARLYGPGFAAGQSAKKAQEALGMAARGDVDKAIHEIHGAIVYLAATAIRLREQA
jgi:hypothetical protein